MTTEIDITIKIREVTGISPPYSDEKTFLLRTRDDVDRICQGIREAMLKALAPKAFLCRPQCANAQAVQVTEDLVRSRTEDLPPWLQSAMRLNRQALGAIWRESGFLYIRLPDSTIGAVSIGDYLVYEFNRPVQCLTKEEFNNTYIEVEP